MKIAHILIIEDEEDILELEEYHLQKEGYETTGFLSTKNVEKFLSQESVDLMIVDRNLPGVEGSEFVSNLREMGYQMPVIFVSAKNQSSEIEEGFLRGGDDYLVKPFNMNELLLRIKSILKRTMGSFEGKIVYRDIVLELDSRRVFIDSNEINLTKLEFELLYFFVKNKNSVFSRYDILDAVWGDEEEKQEKTANVAINRLLKKIDPNRTKDYIKAVRGVGYKLC